MSKKIVIRADLVGKKCTSGILSIVSKLEGIPLSDSLHSCVSCNYFSLPNVCDPPGIKSMVVDEDKCTLTVVGTVDPVCVVHQLRKSCFAASIVSVEDDKPKEKKTPCQEACEKAWKDKYEKACKERCEKACKEPCCDDCGEKGTPYGGHGYRCTPGCYSSPCGLPSCHYYSSGYGYGMRAPPLGYTWYE
ncbi:hypothetical protein VPH35_059334 [Triticum aestivum]|uniref:HMA domain-containing protein n=1 Tax=Triticum aestivum TaxID=4565 RepID=A0A3B6GU66_WHEAT